jgi:hypothetical protein
VSTQLRHSPKRNGTTVPVGRREQLTWPGRSIWATPPLTLRVKVFATRAALDRQIAGAHRDERNATLELRARQLIHPRSRRRAARYLRGIVDSAERIGSRRALSAVVIDPAAVTGARRSIVALARRLEGNAPVSPRGVVLARALLTDGRGPLFNPGCGRSVDQAVAEVEDALVAKDALPHGEPLR